MESSWSQTVEDHLPCGCRFSVRWKGERVAGISHGILTAIFFLDEDGNPMGWMDPQVWLKSACPSEPYLYGTTDAD